MSNPPAARHNANVEAVFGGTSRHSGKKTRNRLSFFTVLGELLITAGLVVGGYIVWQPWYTVNVIGAEQAENAHETSMAWNAEPLAEDEDEEIPVAKQAKQAEVFGVLYIPAFSAKFSNHVAEGTDVYQVLNLPDKGIGRYKTTQMPGEAGNVALAGHRSGVHTTPFKQVMKLRLGDPIFFETKEGWYTYRYRDTEYVMPNEVDVLNPFPRIDGEPGNDQILTLTTCNPRDYGWQERAIVYSTFESFQPRKLGPPAELQELNPTVKAKQE